MSEEITLAEIRTVVFALTRGRTKDEEIGKPSGSRLIDKKIVLKGLRDLIVWLGKRKFQSSKIWLGDCQSAYNKGLDKAIKAIEDFIGGDPCLTKKE